VTTRTVTGTAFLSDVELWKRIEDAFDTFSSCAHLPHEHRDASQGYAAALELRIRAQDSVTGSNPVRAARARGTGMDPGGAA
jgi:hypothetical protein